MPPFTHHIFVCCNQREPGHTRGCCNGDGTAQLKAALKAAIAERGLKGQVRANESGCLDQCEMGPTVVIYPQGIWYGGVGLEDVPRIVERTVMRGEILTELLIPPEALNTKGGHPWRRGAAAEDTSSS